MDELRPHPRKQAVRRQIWELLAEKGVARYPFPPDGPIPNFDGAEEAALRGELLVIPFPSLLIS